MHDLFGGGGGGGGRQISSTVQIRSSSSGNLKLISVPVISDPSRHFSLACSGMRQKIWKSEMCAVLEGFNRRDEKERGDYALNM